MFESSKKGGQAHAEAGHGFGEDLDRRPAASIVKQFRDRALVEIRARRDDDLSEAKLLHQHGVVISDAIPIHGKCSALYPVLDIYVTAMRKTQICLGFWISLTGYPAWVESRERGYEACLLADDS